MCREGTNRTNRVDLVRLRLVIELNRTQEYPTKPLHKKATLQAVFELAG